MYKCDSSYDGFVFFFYCVLCICNTCASYCDCKPTRAVQKGEFCIILCCFSINTPGGGSDYGTFMMFAGITCADFRYDYDFVSIGYTVPHISAPSVNVSSGLCTVDRFRFIRHMQ